MTQTEEMGVLTPTEEHRMDERRASGTARLDLPTVVTAAFAIVDREGLDALTMRRLGTEIGVEAMAIYRYAKNKAALLDAMVGTMMERVVVDVDAADWRVELHRLAGSYRATALEHPAMMPLLAARPLDLALSQRPASVLRATEDMFVLLHRAGMSDDQIVTTYRRFLAWVVGRVLDELRVIVEKPDDPDLVVRLGLFRLSNEHFPLLRRLAPAIADHDAEQDLHDGVDLLLDAVVPRLERRAR